MKDISDEMTMLLALAGVAMHGILSGPEPVTTESVITHSFRIADGMMAEMTRRAEAAKARP